VIESVWHGVPVIGWPLNAQARDNLLRVTARQAGLMLDDVKRPSQQQMVSAFHRIYIRFYKEEMLVFQANLALPFVAKTGSFCLQDMVIDVPYTELNHAAFWPASWLVFRQPARGAAESVQVHALSGLLSAVSQTKNKTKI
jgi:hypothetical protein